MTLENIQAIKTQLEKTYFQWAELMRAFPRGEMGLIPDEVRATAEYKTVKHKCDTSFEALRRFNGSLTNKQKRELARMRRGK